MGGINESGVGRAPRVETLDKHSAVKAVNVNLWSGRPRPWS
jgi:hypothetical protein